jgi:hypothetical protein
MPADFITPEQKAALPKGQPPKRKHRPQMGTNNRSSISTALGKANAYLKERLNYLGERFAELDLVNIAYYPGGLTHDDPILTEAQVGRTNLDMLLESGAMEAVELRDYFIFTDALPIDIKEGDIILDSAYETQYCRVATRNNLPIYKYTNETCYRYRIHTSVVPSPAISTLGITTKLKRLRKHLSGPRA